MSNKIGKSRLRDQVWHDQYTGNQGEVPAALYPTVKAIEKGAGNVRTTIIKLEDAIVALVDEAGVVAYGSLKLYDFPQGYIYVHTAVADIALTKSSAGVDDDWNGDVGLGTVACDNDATLSVTEDDILPTTATPQAASGVTTADGVSTASENVIFDGTTTAKDLYINLLVDDADHDVTTTPCNLILNGEITLTWTFMGDN